MSLPMVVRYKCGGPKKYTVTKLLIMILQGNAAWNMTEENQFVLNTTLENHEKLDN